MEIFERGLCHAIMHHVLQMMINSNGQHHFLIIYSICCSSTERRLFPYHSISLFSLFIVPVHGMPLYFSTLEKKNWSSSRFFGIQYSLISYLSGPVSHLPFCISVLPTTTRTSSTVVDSLIHAVFFYSPLGTSQVTC